MNEIEIINKIINAIQSDPLKRDLLIFRAFSKDDSKTQKTLLADYEIIYDRVPLAVIEIRSKLVVTENTAQKLKYDINTKYRLYIATDGDVLNIFDISKNSGKNLTLYKGTDFSKIYDCLLNIIYEQKSFHEIESLIKAIFFELCQKLIDLKRERLSEKTIYQFPEITTKEIESAIEIVYDEHLIKSKIQDDATIKNLENILFDLIVDDPWMEGKDRIIYRYTTFDAIFSTLHSTKYRLNGIKGMNDQSEGFGILKEFYNEEIVEDSQKISERLNEVFISSCSLKKDDLTMWRLYGDNSKGAGLTIEVDARLGDPFLVKRISYLSNVKKDKLIKEVSFTIARLMELGYRLDKSVFSLIPFFFKTNHYQVEEEVRILFDRSKYRVLNPTVKFDWGISEPYKIVRPFVDIDLLVQGNANEKDHNPFIPFKIKEIRLGPNCPHFEKNEIQIELMIKEYGYGQIGVLRSKIGKDTYIG